MLGTADQINAADFNKRRNKPQLAAEKSFTPLTIKFKFTDSYHNHKITQSGSLNWN
jgi:hypothetical protein